MHFLLACICYLAYAGIVGFVALLSRHIAASFRPYGLCLGGYSLQLCCSGAQACFLARAVVRAMYRENFAMYNKFVEGEAAGGEWAPPAGGQWAVRGPTREAPARWIPPPALRLARTCRCCTHSTLLFCIVCMHMFFTRKITLLSSDQHTMSQYLQLFYVQAPVFLKTVFASRHASGRNCFMPPLCCKRACLW